MSSCGLWMSLVFTLVAFSSIEVVSHPIRDQVDPLVLTFWRFHLGALLLLAIGKAGGEFKKTRLVPRDLLSLFLLGILNVVISMGALAIAIKWARASTVAILISSNPLATNLFAWLILRERLSLGRWISLFLGMVGVMLIVARPMPGEDSWAGLMMGVFAAVSFGLYTALSKPLVERIGSLRTAAVSFGLASLAYFPVLLWSGFSVWPPANTWPRILYLGFIVSGRKRL